jgi:hypothetical protein
MGRKEQIENLERKTHAGLYGETGILSIPPVRTAGPFSAAVATLNGTV